MFSEVFAASPQTKRFSDSTGVTGFGILMYNAAISLPICLVGATLRGEWGYIAAFPYVHSMVSSLVWCCHPLVFGTIDLCHPSVKTFWASLTCASLLGCFMTYVVFLSTTVNSPLGECACWGHM